MSARLAALALAMSILVLPASVAAADQPAAEGFSWPIQRWLEATQLEVDPLALLKDERPRATAVRAGPRASGAVALTFDDGLNSGACARIADTLRLHEAVGTFFINGNWLKSDPAGWRGILDGMEVGNHTRSHYDLTGEPNRVVLKQILENENIHEQVLGRPMLKVLRPPYGAHNDRIRRLAAEAGYDRLAMWNVDTQDWKPKSTAQKIVRRAIGARPGSIILMHCSRSATVKALPAIIRHYQRRGIELAGLSKVMKGAKGNRGAPAPEPYGRP